MKTIIAGSVIFVIWSAISTYYYVCKIKELCPEKQVEQVQIIEEQSITPAPKPEPEPEPLQQLESPGPFTVFHDFDQDQFRQDDQLDKYIKDLNTYLEQESSLKVSVVGFADNIGSTHYNYDLGLRRASYTRNFLVKLGIEENKITASSQGESFPVASNDTDEGRAQNRRTEIRIAN